MCFFHSEKFLHDMGEGAYRGGTYSRGALIIKNAMFGGTFKEIRSIFYKNHIYKIFNTLPSPDIHLYFMGAQYKISSQNEVYHHFGEWRIEQCQED